MKRALIVASVGILASTVWVAAANAQANINQNLYPVAPGARGASQAGGDWDAAPRPNKPSAMRGTPPASPPRATVSSRNARPERLRQPPARGRCQLVQPPRRESQSTRWYRGDPNTGSLKKLAPASNPTPQWPRQRH